MDLIADILLAAGALGAGLYCIVLGKRLNKFNDLEKGVGGAVAVLAIQVDELNRTLTVAQNSASKSVKRLEILIRRAENTERNLELQIASLSDIPGQKNLRNSEENCTEPERSLDTNKIVQPMFVRRHNETGA